MKRRSFFVDLLRFLHAKLTSPRRRRRNRGLSRETVRLFLESLEDRAVPTGGVPAIVYVGALNNPDSAVDGVTLWASAVSTIVEGNPPVPTGTVEFYAGEDDLGVAALVEGYASFTTFDLTPGEYWIWAAYSGDEVYAEGNSDSVSLSVYGPTITYVFDPVLVEVDPYMGPRYDIAWNVLSTFGGTWYNAGFVSLYDNGNYLDTLEANQGHYTTSLAAGNHNIRAVFLGDTYFEASEDDTGPKVIAPTSDGGECGCSGTPLALIPAGNSGPNQSSANPVRYNDGIVTVTATDLSSGSLGLPWGQSRSWTNGAGYSFGSTNGNGWVISQAPHLLQADGTSNDTIILVTSGTTALFYDLDQSIYHGRFYDTSQLSYDDGGAGGDTFTLITARAIS